VTEVLDGGASIKGLTVKPAYPYVSGDGGAPGANDTQSGTIVGGINTITFHNQALGQLEICKDVVDGNAYVPFSISYKQVGGTAAGKVTVASGACSMPQIVPVGQYTISETLPTVTLSNGQKVAAYQFVASDARGPLGDNRCVPQQNSTPLAHDGLAAIQWANSLGEGPGAITNCGLPFTVSVPYFQSTDPVNFGETNVEIWNKVVRAQLKICKQITGDSTAALSSLLFVYTYTVNGTTYGPVVVPAGTCSGLLVDGNLLGFPIVSGATTNNAGVTTLNPSVVTVTEQGSNSTATCRVNNVAVSPFHVDQVTLSGGSPTSNTNPAVPANGNFGGPGLNGKIPYTVAFNPGPGVNVTTFYNQSTQCD